MKKVRQYGPLNERPVEALCTLPDGSRRRFLMQGGVLLSSMALLPALSSSVVAQQAAVGVSSQAFHSLAQFLTGKTLDASLTGRAFDALQKVDSKFPEKAAALSTFVRSRSFADVDAFKIHPELTAERKADALAIISSLYLGYAGQAKTGTDRDNTRFVTYTQALMYRLTERYTPIPSYSRWGTGYWTTIPT